jgi:hypothetical protein
MGPVSTNLGFMNLKTNKIEASSQAFLLLNNRRWGTLFSNGKRVLSDVSDTDIKTGDIAFYPNPVRDELNIQFDASLAGVYNIELYKLDGQLLSTHQKNIIQGSNMIKIPTNTLTSGMYLVQLSATAQKNKYRFKIVKH